MRELGLEPDALIDIARILLAFSLAFPVAWERAHSHRAVGFRTLPIVAMAACGFTLVGKGLVDISPEGQARVLQGVMRGSGFIGSGAIVQRGTDVRGRVTAASIWHAGAIGAAAGFDRVDVGAARSLIVWISTS